MPIQAPAHLIGVTRSPIVFHTTCAYEHVTVHGRQCQSCGHVIPPNGMDAGLWNFDNVLFFTIELLEWLHSFRRRKVTAFVHFVDSLSSVYLTAGQPEAAKRISDSKGIASIQHAYIDFRAIVDPPRRDHFECKCALGAPAPILMDGTWCGLPASAGEFLRPPVDTSYTFSCASPVDRLFFPSTMDTAKPSARTSILNYCSNGLSASDHAQLVLALVANAHNRVVNLGFLVSRFSERRTSGPSTTPLEMVHPTENANLFLMCLISQFPITTVVPHRALSAVERCSTISWSTDAESDVEILARNTALRDLQTNAPIVYAVHYEARMRGLDDVTFKSWFSTICQNLHLVAMAIFAPNGHTADAFVDGATGVQADITCYDAVNDFFQTGEFFPLHERCRRVRSYSVDNRRNLQPRKLDLCSKVSASTRNDRRLLMIFMCAGCNTCIGFSVLPDSESPRSVSDLVFSRFRSAPSTIVYDNGCNLSTFAMLREPTYFGDTTFALDKFHGMQRARNLFRNRWRFLSAHRKSGKYFVFPERSRFNFIYFCLSISNLF